MVKLGKIIEDVRSISNETHKVTSSIYISYNFYYRVQKCVNIKITRVRLKVQCLVSVLSRPGIVFHKIGFWTTNILDFKGCILSRHFSLDTINQPKRKYFQIGDWKILFKEKLSCLMVPYIYADSLCRASVLLENAVFFFDNKKQMKIDSEKASA